MALYRVIKSVRSFADKTRDVSKTSRRRLTERAFQA